MSECTWESIRNATETTSKATLLPRQPIATVTCLARLQTIPDAVVSCLVLLLSTPAMQRLASLFRSFVNILVLALSFPLGLAGKGHQQPQRTTKKQVEQNDHAVRHLTSFFSSPSALLRWLRFTTPAASFNRAFFAAVQAGVALAQPFFSDSTMTQAQANDEVPLVHARSKRAQMLRRRGAVMRRCFAVHFGYGAAVGPFFTGLQGVAVTGASNTEQAVARQASRLRGAAS